MFCLWQYKFHKKMKGDVIELVRYLGTGLSYFLSGSIAESLVTSIKSLFLMLIIFYRNYKIIYRKTNHTQTNKNGK